MIGALTLDQLRILTAVAETGSFSAAGRRLGRVQSAISQSVQGLEGTLGVILFDRATKSPTLTPAGRTLVAQARQVLIQADALQAQAKAMASGLEPSLTLAIDSLFPAPPLVSALRALQEEFPDLSLTLHTEPISAPLRRLRNGSADLALCILLPSMALDLVCEPLTFIDMATVVSPLHPLASLAGPLTRADLEMHVQLILTDPQAEPDAPSFGVVSPKVWRFVDVARRLDFLKAGFGWGNMPVHLVAPMLQAGELVRLRLEEAVLATAALPIYAAYRRSHPLGPAGRWLKARLLEACS